LTGGDLSVLVQYAVDEPGTPAPAFFEDCARRVFGDVAGELVVRVVDAKESAFLNERYRGERGPTNVLAFDGGELPLGEAGHRPFGDLAICAAVVAREAEEQGKSLGAHWAHIVIHGCLHLVGYDHETEAGAAEMEARERDLLGGLGIADPYVVGA